jgi:hypothetical protein
VAAFRSPHLRPVDTARPIRFLQFALGNHGVDSRGHIRLVVTPDRDLSGPAARFQFPNPQIN